ncbi:hypothetical protein [Exiguobacterium sp. s16]|uniref:hypothetical protein n=1 Tax=Exiguobacterium sp. s16 TaxID=2751237 RepID=UPI001BEC03D7|nr:hypothetical protein [Exiguobacterium sp. s16]
MNIERFEDGYLENFNKQCIVTEPGEYEVSFRLPPGSSEGIKIDLPKIKQNSQFLKAPSELYTPPKDCDVILLDIKKRVFYLIEIKSLKKTCDFEKVKLQLAAGFEWLKFICFCLDVDINSYTVFKVQTIANSGRANYKRILKVEEVYRTYGKHIFLDLK